MGLKIKTTTIIYFLLLIGRTNGLLYNNSIAFATLIGIAGIGILANIREIKKEDLRYYLWVLCFLMLYACSIFWADYPERTITNLIATLGRYIITVYLMIGLFNNKTRISVINAYICTVALNAIFVMLAYGPSILMQVRQSEIVAAQFTQQGWNSNTIGMGCAFGIVLLHIKQKYLISSRKSVRLTTVAYIFLAFVTLSTGSKKAIMIVLFYFLMMYTITHRNKLARLTIAGVALIVAYSAMVNIPVLYDLVGERIESFVNGVISLGGITSLTQEKLVNSSLNGSDRVRFNFIILGLQWISEKPFLGHGMANFIDLYGTLYTKSYYAHNNFIEITVGLGIVGLVVYYSIYIYIFRNSIKTWRNSIYAKISITLILLFLVLDMGLVSYLELEIQLMLGVAYLFGVKSDYRILKPGEKNEKWKSCS